MLSATLLSIHNLSILIQLAIDIRNAILEGKFIEFTNSFFVQKRDNTKEEDLN
jgi:tRNA-guanine family transglycosylase